MSCFNAVARCSRGAKAMAPENKNRQTIWMFVVNLSMIFGVPLSTKKTSVSPPMDEGNVE